MIKNNFKDKTILITGASGSIGSALVKKFLKTKCKVVRALSNDENGMFYLSRQIEEANILNFNKNMYKNRIRYLIGDVRDYKRNLQACSGVDIVVHAAAMKHVDICEYNKEEAKKTNIHGTNALIKAAAKNKVKFFLFISTDKAVDPNSVMGKSKLDAEKIVLKNNNKYMKCSSIRFGNVIGSRGSVLPFFLKQIKNKKELFVTDKRATRFFTTINYASNEVLNTIQIMRGNELFLINNMKSIKIFDLANALKKIFNYSKNIKFTKLKKGEKLHESLIEDKYNRYLKKEKNLIFINLTNKKNSSDNKKKIKYNSENKNLRLNQIIKFLIKEVQVKKHYEAIINDNFNI